MAHPENWNTLTLEEKRAEASKLLNGMRGHLIIGQALARAILVMREEKFPEHSNIEDMECLGMLFEPFFSMYLGGTR